MTILRMYDGYNRPTEPAKPWPYHAIVDTGDPTGVHRRVSIYADSLNHAKAILESEHGAGSIVSLWGDVESQRTR